MLLQGHRNLVSELLDIQDSIGKLIKERTQCTRLPSIRMLITYINSPKNSRSMTKSHYPLLELQAARVINSKQEDIKNRK